MYIYICIYIYIIYHLDFDMYLQDIVELKMHSEQLSND